MDKRSGKRAILGILAVLLGALAATGGKQAVSVMAEGRAAHTLVIDAGHGGFDGGAAGSGGTTEQDINLSIARRVQALAAFFGMKTVMTRTDENALEYDPARPVRENKAADIKARARVAQEAENPLFVSIHLNKFSDARYHGAQVFYSTGHAGSKTAAELLQAALVAGCDPENHRQAKQAEKSIYLMKTLTCPAVIVECGFLSNPQEEERLTRPEYHKKLAACIVYGCLQYINGG